MKYRIRKDDTRIKYILTFNPSNPNMTDIILQHLHMVARIKRNFITQENIQIVYRKSQNKRDLIISGIVNRLNKPSLRCQPFRDTHKKDCIYCKRIVHTNTITSTQNITHKIIGFFNCQSKNFVYCPTCICCNKKYIGESSQTVNNRLRGQESHIRNYQRHPSNPVAQHFGINVNNGKDYKIEILDQETDKNRRL